MKDSSGSSSYNKVYHWFCLRFIKGIGNSTFLALLNRFGTAESVLEADAIELKAAGLRENLVANILKRRYKIDPEKELEKVISSGVRVILYDDPEYPALLKEIDYPPVFLYALGKKIPKDQFFMSVVGARSATQYGIRVSRDFSYRLAAMGIGIVSGMARGIDTHAHLGALKAGGYTVAVLGTGIDIIYPKENKEVFQNIKENGTIITEFSFGTPPEAKNFPARNRIISGMSKGVLVVEATKRSGSLITAYFALTQGREVFAVPGSIESVRSRGTHFLIKQGAKLVEEVEDILEEFGIEPSFKTDQKKQDFKLDSREEKIYKCLSEYPVHIDEIIKNTGIDPAEVLSSLLKMEIKGLVRQMPGKLFIKRQ